MGVLITNSANQEIPYLRGSVSFEDTINSRGTMSFAAITNAPPIALGADVFLFDSNESVNLELVGGGELELIEGGFLTIRRTDPIWGGTVEGYDESDYTVGSEDVLLFNYRCVDFDQIASKRLVARAWTNTNAGTIVTDLLASTLFSGEGVTAGEIGYGETIESIQFNWVPGDYVLDELAEVSGYAWRIDADKKLHFTPRGYTPAVFNITASNKPYLDIKFSRNRTQLRTTQYVRAASELSDERVEIKAGDGVTRAFLAELNIGTTPTIQVDTGGGYSTKTLGVEGAAIGKEWYYSVNSKVFSQDASETVLSSSDRVKITYQARVPLIVSNTNYDLETDRASVESGTGRYESIFDAPDIDTRAEAVNKAVSLMNRYGNLQETVTYTTDVPGVLAGTIQNINLSAHGVNADFLIERVVGYALDNETIRYSVSASASQAYGGWTAYFKAKTRQDRKFIPRENEAVLNILSVDDSLTVSDTPSATAYTYYEIDGVDTYINGFFIA